MSEREDKAIVDEQDVDDQDVDAHDDDVPDGVARDDVEDRDDGVRDEDTQDDDGLDADEPDDDESEDEEVSAIDSMREMVEYIARALASNPDAVSVTEEDGGDRIYLHLSVDDQDKGKVIGRDGRVAQSMRSLLRVAAVKANTRISLEID